MNNLPEINFADTDASGIEQSIITTYEAVSVTTLAPGDPVRLFLESLAVIISQQRFLIDFSGKQNLIRYSSGDFLDHLGAFTETERLEARAAWTTIRFSIAEALGFVVAIPAGTRVSPDGQLFFSTMANVQITIGETQVDVPAECLTAGTLGNGYLPGQINRLVDPKPYLTGAENITLSLGGADAELDDPYRERVRQGPEKFSTAGPAGAYVYWAKSAHQDIMDVAVYSPADGVVNVRPLMTGGELPDADILLAVETALSDRTVRPLTDLVQVDAPEAVSYDVTLTYYIGNQDAARVSLIQEAVQSAVDAFVLWQKSAMGRDINPSELIYRVKDAGAKRVEVTSPMFQALDEWQIAQDNTITVAYGGLEAD